MLAIASPSAGAQALEALADARQIASGSDHSCIRTASGGVRCWGSNTFGQLGDGTKTDRTIPVDVVGLHGGVAQIRAGGNQTCAMLTDGSVRCWGRDPTIALPDINRPIPDERLFILVPKEVFGPDAGVESVAVGLHHSCVLIADGARCWGRFRGNIFQDLVVSPPAVFPGLESGVTAVSVGDGHTCGLFSDGSVSCAGDYNPMPHDGVLRPPVGTDEGFLLPRFQAPEPVAGVAGAHSLVSGRRFACVLRQDGVATCWNSNSAGPSVSFDLGGGVRSLSTGTEHVCAVSAAGGAFCRGLNRSGQLGDGSTIDRTEPAGVTGLVSGVAAVSAGEGHSCALLGGGTVECWGSNDQGQLGDGSRLERPVPLDVASLGFGQSQVRSGLAHSCALSDLGVVTCWGANESGQLGDGSTTDRDNPVTVIGLGGRPTSIALGDRHSCALTAEGGVKCWGFNGYGQLGNGTESDHPLPVDVQGLTSGVTAITAAGYHTCALTAEGGVKCWGGNLDGQLGIGTRASSSVPRDVAGLASGVVKVDAGGFLGSFLLDLIPLTPFGRTCALTEAGSVKCWGGCYQEAGNFFCSSTNLLPRDITGLGTTVSAISVGAASICVVSPAGEVRCSDRLNAPFEPVAGLESGIESVTLGAGFGCATTFANGIKCWGKNESGQLGNGSIGIAEAAASDVSGAAENTLMVDAGSNHACAITMGGSAKCWGSDSNGQVGDVGRSYPLAATVVYDASRSRIISLSNGGNAGSDAAVVDAIARFTVFESSADNLVAGDSNHSIDVFRRDGSDGSVIRISVADDGSEIDGDSIEPSVSASGQWVVFVAPDSALGKLRGESSAAHKQRRKSSTYGVFLRNLSTGSTQRVGTALPGGSGTRPVIAPLGDAIAFAGLPTVPGQGTPGISTILVVPLQLAGNELLPGLPSCPLCAPLGNAFSQSPSRNPALSADGRWLAFESEAASVAGLATSCPQASSQILLHDRHTGSTVSASSLTDPVQCSDGGSRNPSIDWAGGSLVFETELPLDVDDRNGISDIYRYQTASGEHERISTDPRTGHDGLDASTRARISGDGKVVSFQSLATNLESSEPDSNDANDIFVRNLETGSMRRVNRNRRGDQGNSPSDGAALSWDGAAVVFVSDADNLLLDPATGSPADINSASDVFQVDNALVPIRKTGTWWVPSESGWGLSTIDQGNALGVSWFTYDTDGEPTWFSGSAQLQSDGRYVGSVFRHTGVPLADINGVATESSTHFADVILSFTGSGALTFDYAVIGGPTQRKQMSRFIFAGDDIVCRVSPFPSRSSIGNLSDVWWGGAATSGWGILLSDSTSIMAATWYTFDQDREAIFLIAIMARQSDGAYTGSIFRQRNGTPFGNINNVPPSSGSDAIGTARFDTIDAETADFSYTVGAVSQTKRISRFVFGTTPNVCSTARP